MKKILSFSVLTALLTWAACKDQNTYQDSNRKRPVQSPSPTPGGNNPNPNGNGTGNTTAGTFKFCMTGDTGSGESDQDDVAKAMESEKCNAVVIAGDVIYDSGIDSADDKQLTSKFFKPFEGLMNGQNLPMYLTLGNHDYRGDPKPWLDVAKKNPKVIMPNLWYDAQPAPGICLFAYDTNDSQPEQEKWFSGVKSKYTGNCKFSIAIAHHPYRSSGHHKGELESANKKLMESSILGKVDLFFAAHEHHLEDAGAENGTKLLIAGGGGRDLRALEADPVGGFGLSSFGYLTLTVNGSNANFDFIAVKGSTKKSVHNGTIQGKGLR
ncbi:MAG: metallophosphoesterase [Oligoflexales bacterium]